MWFSASLEPNFVVKLDSARNFSIGSLKSAPLAVDRAEEARRAVLAGHALRRLRSTWGDVEGERRPPPRLSIQ
jgi:hypothetical protein